MTIHSLSPSANTLHGYFSRELPPVLTIDSGDTVCFQTLEAGWGLIEQPDIFKEKINYPVRDPDLNSGHALVGPVRLRGAKSGMVLEVRLKRIIPGDWGFTVAGGFPSYVNDHTGINKESSVEFRWKLNRPAQTATNQFGHTVRTRPFIGLMGMPPDEPGVHSTIPPRFCGGNIDCKDIVDGSSLFLPISVDGALFSIGDGHAAQGHGEIANPALECPMETIELEFHVHPAMTISMPRARTPHAWLAFGFHKDLNRAFEQALDQMLALMSDLHGLSKVEAVGLASLVVDFHITQVANGVCGVHGVLPHDALARV